MTPEEAEIFKVLRRRILTQRSCHDEMLAILDSLVGEQKTIKETDGNNEPTFDYAVKRNIPGSIYLTARFKAYALEYGFDLDRALVIFLDFKEYYERNANKPNGKWSRWSLVWFKWVRKQHDLENKPQATPTRFGQSRTRG